MNYLLPSVRTVLGNPEERRKKNERKKEEDRSKYGASTALYVGKFLFVRLGTNTNLDTPPASV